MIIFLNGSKDAGKTTTAMILKRKDKRIAVVEPDVFFPFLPDHLSILEKAPYCVELSARCARKLYEAGFLVVIAYPLTDWDHGRYRDLLEDIPEEKMLYVTLAPEKEKLFKRLNLIHDESDEGRFRRSIIEAQYERGEWGFGVVYPSYATHIVDNSDLSPEETADAVYSIIKAGLKE